MWFNWACLGEGNSDDGRLDIALSTTELRRLFRECVRWVSRWAGCPPDTVVLTSGTTDACDVVLRTAFPAPQRILYTNHAHVTVRRSACNAAQFLTRFAGSPVAVSELIIDDLIGLPPMECAARMVRRVRDASQGEDTVLIIEHITSLCGATLPIGAISRALRDSDHPIRLVVDGAQAVGIQPIPEEFSGSYIGCFHKYVDGPSACGFAVVPDVRARALPYRLAARLWTACEGADADEGLPTDDLRKWTACETALLKLERSRGESILREQVMVLRRILDEAIKPITTTPLLPPDSEYRSHIAAIDCGYPARASFVHGELCRLGYLVKVQDRWLRVSLHHTLDVAGVRSFARALQRLLSETESRNPP